MPPLKYEFQAFHILICIYNLLSLPKDNTFKQFFQLMKLCNIYSPPPPHTHAPSHTFTIHYCFSVLTCLFFQVRFCDPRILTSLWKTPSTVWLLASLGAHCQELFLLLATISWMLVKEPDSWIRDKEEFCYSAVVVARLSAVFLWFPEPQFPQGDTKRFG